LQFALEAEEILNHMKLMEIQNRTWNIQACSALTKEGKFYNHFHLSRFKIGLQEGMEWLVKTISEKK
jgi:hypothetical protein